MEVSGRKKDSDVETQAKIEHVCQPCQEENVRQKACGFCRTCEEYLCGICFKYHRRPKPFKNHVLIDAKSFTSNNTLSSLSFQNDNESIEVLHYIRTFMNKDKAKQIPVKPNYPDQEKEKLSEDKVLLDEGIKIGRQKNIVECPPPLLPENKQENVIESPPPLLPENKQENVIESPPPLPQENKQENVVESPPPLPPENKQENVVESPPPLLLENKQENVVESPPPPLPERRMIFKTKCSIHTSEDLKCLCRIHKQIVCSVCALKEHKQCEMIDYIHDIYETERDRIVSKINYVEDKVAYIIKSEDDADEISDAAYEKALSDIISHRKLVNKHFDDTEKQLRNEYTSCREVIKKRKRDLLEISCKLKRKEKLISDTNVGSEIERFILMNEEEVKVENINKDLIGVFGQPRLHVSYNPHFPLFGIGRLELTKQGDVASRNLELLEKINISKDGEACSIIDMTTLSNGSFPFILADSKNKRVIGIFDKYSLCFHQLQSKPWGITYINDDKPTGEIAITLPWKDSVVFINVSKEISSSSRKSIEISFPTAIRYHTSDSILIIVSKAQERSSFQCWSVNGEFVRTIASFNYYIRNIDLTSDERIIFTSAEKHCLGELDLTGNVIKFFHYIDDNMNGPYGIASDKNQSIYVCGYDCLRVVSKEGKWDNILTSNDGFGPQSLHVCNKTDRLFIGQGIGKLCNNIIIFQL